MTKICGLIFICFGGSFAWAQGLNVFHIDFLKSGTIQCSPDTFEFCELSAIATIRNQNGVLELYAANDKKPRNPRTSSLMQLRVDDDLSVAIERFIDIPKAVDAEKFEAMTSLPDGTLIVSTAFNYINRVENNRVLAMKPFLTNEIYEVITTDNIIRSDVALVLPFVENSLPPIGNHCKTEILSLTADANSLHKPQYSEKIKTVQEAIRCLELQKVELQKLLSSEINTKLAVENKRKLEPAAARGLSISIRNLINDALDLYTKQKNDYFKIEGITTYGENKIVFAVREYGLEFDKRTYSSIFIEGVLSFNAGVVSINHLQPFKMVADFSSELKKATGKNVGVSSLEYNKSDGKLYFLTSFEPNDDVAKKEFSSYLWSVDLNLDYSINRKTLAMAKFINNSSVDFQHKAEGLAFLNENTAIVVHDDDRELTGINGRDDPKKRKSNEAVYTIFKIVKYPRREFGTQQ